MFRNALLVGGALASSSHVDNVKHIAAFSDSDKLNHPEIEQVFNDVYESLEKQFPTHAYATFLQTLQGTLHEYTKSKAYNAYKTVPLQPHCDGGVGSAVSGGGIAAFPGGVVKRALGFDLAKMMEELASKASGPAGASSAMLGPLTMSALSAGAGIVQGIVSSALMIVPPMIPPPVWTNQPLNCMPMAVGKNCLGAVLYPISMADFVSASVTDSGLDGVVASFPSLYAKKVGKTSDAAYRTCFNAYMSLQCSAAFPMCATAMARNEAIPGTGRMPACVTHCISTLVACPGFWLEDIMGQCQDVSVPPQCSFALFLNSWLAPPQYQSFEESAGTPMECPRTDLSLDSTDASKSFDLYDTSADSVTASPFSGGASSVPN